MKLVKGHLGRGYDAGDRCQQCNVSLAPGELVFVDESNADVYCSEECADRHLWRDGESVREGVLDAAGHVTRHGITSTIDGTIIAVDGHSVIPAGDAERGKQQDIDRYGHVAKWRDQD